MRLYYSAFQLSKPQNCSRSQESVLRSQESKASFKVLEPQVATEYKSSIVPPGADRLWSIHLKTTIKKATRTKFERSENVRASNGNCYNSAVTHLK